MQQHSKALENSTICDFLKLEELGCGSAGRVYKVCHKTKPSLGLLALKVSVYDSVRDREAAKACANDFFSHCKLEHPHIVTVFRGYNDPTYFAFVMEYVRGGTVESFLQSGNRFSLNEIKRLLNQIGSALAFIHKKKIAHYDITARNILMTEDMCFKLTDFDLSAPAYKTQYFPRGNIVFMPPEMLLGEGYNYLADVWAFGVLAFYIAFVEFPFKEHPKPLDTMQEICFKDLEFPDEMPLAFESLVKGLLQRNRFLRTSWKVFFDQEFLK